MSIFDRKIKATKNIKVWYKIFNNMEDIQNNPNNKNNAYVNCRASDITKLLRTPIDRKNIAKELSKL